MTKRTLRLVISTLLIAMVATALFPTENLEIVSRDSLTHLISLPAVVGDEFTIRYMHSVARRPVDESFEIQADGVLNLKSTEWDMNGAGLPYEPEDTMVFKMEKGKYILTNINRSFPQIVQAVGTVAQHQIIYKGRSLRLEKVTPPGTAVRIRAADAPRYMVWYDHIKWRLLSDPCLS